MGAVVGPKHPARRTLNRVIGDVFSVLWCQGESRDFRVPLF
jgi:hypothetical protein